MSPWKASRALVAAGWGGRWRGMGGEVGCRIGLGLGFAWVRAGPGGQAGGGAHLGALELEGGGQQAVLDGEGLRHELHRVDVLKAAQLRGAAWGRGKAGGSAWWGGGQEACVALHAAGDDEWPKQGKGARAALSPSSAMLFDTAANTAGSRQSDGMSCGSLEGGGGHGGARGARGRQYEAARARAGGGGVAPRVWRPDALERGSSRPWRRRAARRSPPVARPGQQELGVRHHDGHQLGAQAVAVHKRLGVGGWGWGR
jgi:hypothetical protein